jgi:hypothetical protein
METIKRKILLENSIDRSSKDANWGRLTATTFYINILLTQNIDDMGLFTDTEYIVKDKVSTPPNYTELQNKLIGLGLTFPFMSGAINPYFTKLNTAENLWGVLRYPTYTKENYYNYVDLVITATTDSRLEDVRSYASNNPYRVGFNVNTETYVNYENITVDGVDLIKSMDEPKLYVFDTPNDINLGTDNQINGLQFKDYSQNDTTIVRYIGEGFNDTNITLSALTKEEYLFGIISPPEVQNDVFIDRGITSVMDRHLRFSEIRSLKGLENYGNGFYRLNKQ